MKIKMAPPRMDALPARRVPNFRPMTSPAVQMTKVTAAMIAAQTAEMDAAEADAARSPTEKKLDAARAFELEEEDAVREILATLDARKEQVELELDKVKARRDELAQAVPPDQLRYYERLRLTRWPCIAAFNRAEGVCTGCNLVQPPSVKQAVSHADKDPANAPLVTCPACGRILA